MKGVDDDDVVICAGQAVLPSRRQLQRMARLSTPVASHVPNDGQNTDLPTKGHCDFEIKDVYSAGGGRRTEGIREETNIVREIRVNYGANLALMAPRSGESDAKRRLMKPRPSLRYLRLDVMSQFSGRGLG